MLIVHAIVPWLSPPMRNARSHPPRSMPVIATLDVVLDRRLQRRGVRTNYLADLLAVLKEEEGRHSAHSQLLRDFRDLVDVELVEAGVGVGIRVPFGAISSVTAQHVSGVGSGIELT